MKKDEGKAKENRGDSKLSVKKQSGRTKKGAKKVRKAKDPNMPKRPPTAFFLFMEDFRKQYKKEHPNNKSAAVVSKAGGEEWRSMTDDNKAPYLTKNEKRKAEYSKSMAAYRNGIERSQKQEAGDESDKSMSEVHNDDVNEESMEELDDYL